ncbi:hypothetical protein JCM11641_000612, partial [Rhodosporidiobolus odoratus]
MSPASSRASSPGPSQPSTSPSPPRPASALSQASSNSADDAAFQIAQGALTPQVQAPGHGADDQQTRHDAVHASVGETHHDAHNSDDGHSEHDEATEDNSSDQGSAHADETPSCPPPPPPALPSSSSVHSLSSVPGSLQRTLTPSLASTPSSAFPDPSASSRPSALASESSPQPSRLAPSDPSPVSPYPRPNRLSLALVDDDDGYNESTDSVTPLSRSTSTTTQNGSSSHARRPFSLSSQPETPTATATARTTLTSPTTSPARSRKSLLLSSSHGPSSDPTAVGRDSSPSLTEAVWRQSMRLTGASPLGTPIGEQLLEEVRLDLDLDGEDRDESEEGEGEEGGTGDKDGPETPRRGASTSSPRKPTCSTTSPYNHSPRRSPPKRTSTATAPAGQRYSLLNIDSSSLLAPSAFGSSSSSGSASARERQASIATPHAADGFLTSRASQNLSLSIATAGAGMDGSTDAEGGLVDLPLSPGVKEIQAHFEKVRREREREVSASTGEGEKVGSGEEGEVDWEFWGRVMSDYEGVAREQPRELSRAIQKGIPPALRGMTWQLMAAAKDPTLESIYSNLLSQSSPHEKSIARDLNRTFPKHEYFREGREVGGVGQENLFNVVKAYSLYDEEVGYTQGLQFIVGPLLLNMPDEEAFCVLVRLMKAYDLRSHYTPNMPGLQLRLFQFDRLVEELLPGVFLHLLRQGVKSSMYASQWFLTLFGYRFPLELVSSVFDLVFGEGVEAVFRFAVALLKRNEDHICQLEFEDLIDFLKNGLFEGYAPDPQELKENPEALYKVNEFVREALQVRITPLML